MSVTVPAEFTEAGFRVGSLEAGKGAASRESLFCRKSTPGMSPHQRDWCGLSCESWDSPREQQHGLRALAMHCKQLVPIAPQAEGSQKPFVVPDSCFSVSRVPLSSPPLTFPVSCSSSSALFPVSLSPCLTTLHPFHAPPTLWLFLDDYFQEHKVNGGLSSRKV